MYHVTIQFYFILQNVLLYILWMFKHFWNFKMKYIALLDYMSLPIFLYIPGVF